MHIASHSVMTNKNKIPLSWDGWNRIISISMVAGGRAGINRELFCLKRSSMCAHPVVIWEFGMGTGDERGYHEVLGGGEGMGMETGNQSIYTITVPVMRLGMEFCCLFF